MTEVIKPIPSRIKSGVVGGYVTGAADIIDDEKNMSQAAVNAAVDAEIGDDNTEGTIKGRIADLEEAVGPGGSVEEQIQAAIAELDATESQIAGTDGLALSVTEVDGVITGISGSIATNTYDSYGAASTVETNLLGDAGTNYNTLGKLEDAVQAEASTRETEIGTDSTSGTVKGRIKSLETLVGSTSVDSQIDTKINALDVTKSQTAGADGLALSIEEENGKIKSISGSIAANTYDAYGSAAAEKTRAEGAEGTLQGNIDAEETRAKAAEKTNADNITAEETRATTAEGLLDGRLDDVEEVIPSAATSTNQLADKSFVNSSVSTATATFRGTSATGLTEAQFLTWANSLTKDANDYVFWNTADAAGTSQFKRYKYNGSAWVYEYTLNNSSFTADQWATINSLLTSTHKTKLDALPTNAELTTLFAGKEDVINDLATIRSGAAAGATAYQKPSTGIPSSDMTSAVQTSLGKADSAYQKPATGIPSTDLASGVQTSLGKADTAIQSDDLATVATTGSYNDLVDKPSIPSGQVQADWNQTNTSEVDYIKNKPTIPTVPTNVSAFTNDAGYLTDQDVSGKANKSEMSVSTSGDETTITLKSGTSATVINAHQDLSGKQDILVSGTNIKTINNNSLLGSGNINIQAGGTYTEGNGIDITNSEISVKAGSNLSFDANGNLNATDTTYSDATTSTSGLMSSADKTKLEGIASGAEVNQNAFSNVAVGNTTISADGKTDTLTLVAGSNVTITPDATNDQVTIAATDTTYSAATTSAAGLMSADDKTKLNGIASGATKVTTDTVSGWGYTKNAGTVTGVKINGTTKSPSSGVVDLGTVITEHQDISGKVNTSTKVNGHALTGDVTVSKTDVGLENVTNDAQVKRSEMGVASGVATLDSAGKVPSSQLPSYVDDVLEYDTKPDFPSTGEAGKIYVDKSTNTSWRWSGSTYTQIKGDLAIGTTTGTAADGGTANAHYSNTSNPHGVTKTQVGLGDVVNTGDSATPVSGGTTKFTTGGAYTELAKKVDKVTGKGLSTNDYTTDEKNKLGGIEAGAQKHIAPTAAEVKSALGTGSGTTKYLREDGTWQEVSALPEVEIGETAPTEDVKLFVDEDADPTISIDVYTRQQTDTMISDTVHLSAQTLTDAQKAQARTNIGLNDVDAKINQAVSTEQSRAQAAEQLLQEQYNGLTQSDIIVGALPASGTKNMIYRVPGTNTYSDYMWNGTSFVKMAEYDNAIDDEPTADSDNLVKSGGVYSSTPSVANSLYESDLDISDEQGNILMRLSNGHIKVKNFDSSKIVVPEEDTKIMEKKLNLSDFSGWEISGDEATTSTLNGQLKYNVVTYEDIFDMSFDFICQGSSFELAFGKNGTSLAGTMCSISSDNTIKLYLNNSTLKKTISLSSLNIISGRNYHVTLKRRSKETTLFYITITDLFNGVSETVKIIVDGNSDVGYMWGAWAIYLKAGTSATVKKLSICLEKDINLMIVGHSFIEGNSISNNKDKRYASIIADTIEGTYISGQGGATTGTFTNGTFAAEASFFPNCKYVFFNLGTNDGSDTNIINGLTTLKQQAISAGLTPIFATVSPDLRNGTNMHDTANNWIKGQEYYIDITTAFLNDDNTVNLNSMFSDRVHPTIETHSKIANICISYLTSLLNYKTI